jgi:hypothetical protein
MARRLGAVVFDFNRELARNRLLSGGYQPRFAAGSYLVSSDTRNGPPGDAKN